ncbi:MAG: ATP12 family chaperone protein [Xanthobacteraceae bacterium]
MRDIFEDIFANQPLDPIEAARRSLRPSQRKRFFKQASVGEETGDGFPVLLDGKPVRTPARRLLAAPAHALAQAIACEWQDCEEYIEPARMPLTRLANTIIDGVAGAEMQVAAEVEKYLGSDLVFYRATLPEGLVARQSAQWDPLLAFARDELGARFFLASDITYVAQPEHALAAAASAIPREPWRLGAVHVVTTLTGSALIALALANDAISTDAAWTAAHVDEDWNMEFWGRDELAMERRAFRFADMQAAAVVIAAMRAKN